CVDIVYVPIHDSASRDMRLFVEWRVFALDQAQFVLVVTDAKFTVSRALEVGFDAQQFSVPPLCRLQIGCPITDRGEASQWLCLAHCISPFSFVKAIHQIAFSIPCKQDRIDPPLRTFPPLAQTR